LSAAAKVVGTTGGADPLVRSGRPRPAFLTTRQEPTRGSAVDPGVRPTARVAGIVLAAITVAAASALAQSLDYSTASPSAAQIDQYLMKRKSPMVGMGRTFADNGRTYAVDPRLLVAISGAETSFGARVCAANNSWNWFHHGTCPASPFDSYMRGDEQVTKYLRLGYINKGYNTIPLIRSKYCAEGCEHWIPNVTLFFGEMPTGGGAPPAPPPPVMPTPVTPAPVKPPPPAPVSPPVTPPSVAPVPPAPPAPKSGPPPAPSKEPAHTAEKSAPPTAPVSGPVSAPVPSGGSGSGGAVPGYVWIILGVLAVGAWVTSGSRKGKARP
jgi:hypothetical protein